MSKSQFRKILAGAINDNKCIVISTHQVKDLEALIDYITIIDEGKILFNHSINEILDKLTFKLSFDAADVEDVLYSEPSLTGKATILRNKENETGKIDLELLYKAVITNGSEIRDIFNAEMA
jgi:ABC-2 type transport system ATP-binding protein